MHHTGSLYVWGLILSRQNSQVFIRALFMELWGLMLSGVWGVGTNHPPSPRYTPTQTLVFLLPASFVGLFHFDFMFAHLMGPRQAEQRHSRKDPMRRSPLYFLHSHIHINTHLLTHTGSINVQENVCMCHQTHMGWYAETVFPPQSRNKSFAQVPAKLLFS